MLTPTLVIPQRCVAGLNITSRNEIHCIKYRYFPRFPGVKILCKQYEEGVRSPLSNQSPLPPNLGSPSTIGLLGHPFQPLNMIP